MKTAFFLPRVNNQYRLLFSRAYAGLCVILFSGFFTAVGVHLWRSPSPVSSFPAAVSSPSAAVPPQNQAVPLMKKIKSQAPSGNYIVIDTGQNILYLKKGEEIQYQAQVSTGSGNILREPSGGRKWVFDTPRGVFQVRKKVKNPTWIKPDWAFIEDGEKIPTAFKERVVVGGLGAYAIGIGDGYFIHGTLYNRLLGRNVSHGCVRVSDEDIENIFAMVSKGTKVIIF